MRDTPADETFAWTSPGVSLPTDSAAATLPVVIHPRCNGADMRTLILPRHLGLLWSRVAAAVAGPAQRRPTPIERYLSEAVDFADLKHRVQSVEEYECRRMW